MLRVLTTRKPRIKRSRAPAILRTRLGSEQRQAIDRPPTLPQRTHWKPVYSKSLHAASLTRSATRSLLTARPALTICRSEGYGRP